MRPFSATEIALDGPRLVEASAGTGKTHAITTLVVRLVVERGLPIDRILVVTFTEAATAELRARIRGRLRTALDAASGLETDDAEIQTIVARSPEARPRLAVALTHVDRASVFTIHGFCHRTLLESAFDSGARFDVELLTNTQALRDEVLLDFWTRKLHRASEAEVRSLRDNRVTPSTLGELVDRVTRNPRMPVLPEEAAADVPEAAKYARAFEAAKPLWDQARIEQLLSESTALHGNKYRSTSVVKWCEQIDRLFAKARSDAPVQIDDGLRKLTPASLRDGVKKGYEGREPQHAFFGAWAELIAERDAYAAVSLEHTLAFKKELVSYVRTELAHRKESLGVMGFDDLLTALRRALDDPALGARLARAVRSRYPAALIDEFQDTDPTQWEIFRTIYGASDVVLIGDPKQAIYAFRGADVFAYLGARDHVAPDEQFTMSVSWRSDPALLNSISALYDAAPHPFAIDAIRYMPLGARPGAEDELVGAAPFELLFVRRGDDKRVQSDRLQRLPHVVASEIRQLLDGGATIAGRPVEAADVAVLTRTNRQAFDMQRALNELGVHSVVLGDQSVFEHEQPEARELSLVLAAVVEPTNNMALRSALTTELIGVSANELARLENDEDGWDGWVALFRRLSALWHGRGFVQMFRALMRSTQMVERLLGLTRGERRVTNLLHLMELLQTAASTEHLGPAALLGWLDESRRPEAAKLRPESTQIRLESDARAVRITTVHRSKGLEYPIVYCPHLADGTLLFSNEKASVSFHDETDGGRIKLDLEGQPDHVARAEEERFAENLRLMYVALTRAKHRCVVVWGALGKTYETSPLGYLLHAPPLAARAPSVAELKSHVRSLGDDRMLAEVREKLGGAVAVKELSLDVAGVGEPPPPADVVPLSARVVREPVRTFQRTASFSELVAESRGAHHGTPVADARDLDEAASAATEVAPGASESVTLRDFPRGAKAGEFFHDILEHHDFRDAAGLPGLVAERLGLHGFDGAHADVVVTALTEMLETPLPITGRGTVRLADLPREDRLDELEFYFPVANPMDTAVPTGAQLSLAFSGAAPSAVTLLSAAELAAPFVAHGSEELDPEYGARVAQLSFLPLEGFLKGYIDLVFRFRGKFYVVDYKSNHLGDTLADYGPPQLREAMSHGHYYLQAHLYAVAVHRFLALRVPDYRYERHFGGVHYLFLKGMRPEQTTGVFFERPPVKRIEALSDVLKSPPHMPGRSARRRRR